MNMLVAAARGMKCILSTLALTLTLAAPAVRAETAFTPTTVLEASTPAGKPAWRYEREAFLTVLPASGACPANLVPVYRLYNRGGKSRTEPNHRYVTDPALHEAMQAKGWLSEGVHMCASHD